MLSKKRQYFSQTFRFYLLITENVSEQKLCFSWSNTYIKEKPFYIESKFTCDVEWPLRKIKINKI